MAKYLQKITKNWGTPFLVVVTDKILETAQSPNFPFLFFFWFLGIWGFDFGLGFGLGLVN